MRREATGSAAGASIVLLALVAFVVWRTACGRRLWRRLMRRPPVVRVPMADTQELRELRETIKGLERKLVVTSEADAIVALNARLDAIVAQSARRDVLIEDEPALELVGWRRVVYATVCAPCFFGSLLWRGICTTVRILRRGALCCCQGWVLLLLCVGVATLVQRAFGMTPLNGDDRLPQLERFGTTFTRTLRYVGAQVSPARVVYAPQCADAEDVRAVFARVETKCAAHLR